MNARDLPEKWEREAENLKAAAKTPDASEHARLTYQSYIYKACAKELRAALPEQPQEEWERTAYNEWVRVSDGCRVVMTLEGYAQDMWSIAGGRRGFRSAKSAMLAADADLDAQHDQDRELLQKLPRELDRAAQVLSRKGDNFHDAGLAGKLHGYALEIRKHLEGDSDENSPT